MFYSLLFVLAFISFVTCIFKIVNKVCDVEYIFISIKRVRILYSFTIITSLILSIIYCISMWKFFG